MSTANIRFLRQICPRKDYCCDGKFLKDRELDAKDIGKCRHYDPASGYHHPQRPVKRLHDEG
jgi:hypothetical protein